MFCLKCGNKLPDDAMFCNGCGMPTKSNTQSMPQSPSPTIRATTDFSNPAQQSQTPTSNAVPFAPYPAFPAQWSEPSQFPPTQFVTGPGTGQINTGFSSMPSPLMPPTTTAPPLFTGPGYMPPASVPPTASMPYMQAPPGYEPTASVPMPTQFSGPYMPAPTGMSNVAPPPPPPKTHPPTNPNWVQRILLRLFGPQLASHPLLGVALGSILAIVLGVLATDLLLNIAYAFVPHQANPLDMSIAKDLISYNLGILPFHDSFRDSLQLFLVMHGVGLHIQYSNGSYINFSPLNGLLLIPALLLILSGYIAASTDFRNYASSSLWRGVFVALPYTLILYIMALQVNGCLPNYGSANSIAICSGSTSQNGLLSMDIPTLLLFGLLWGGLFGLLGASLKLGQGQWRRMVRQFLHASKNPQLMGMIVGGLVSTGLAIGLALLVLFSFVAYTSYSVPLLAQQQHFCAISGDWLSLLVWSIAQGPLHAGNILFLSLGAPLTITNPQHTSCFYTTNTTTFSLFGTTPQLSNWLRLLLLLPAITLFIGGRASAAIGRAQGPGPGAIQGALIAIPFTVLMALLVPLSTVTAISVNMSNNGLANTPIVQTAGSSIFDLLLWTLLWGAVFGVLGGIYQTSRARASISSFVHALCFPLRALSWPFFALLDKLTKQPRTLQRSRTRSLLYTTLLCALLLTIAAVAGGVSLIAFDQTLTFTMNYRIRDIASVILIALPGLLLLCTAAGALAHDPQPQQQPQPPVSTFIH